MVTAANNNIEIHFYKRVCKCINYLFRSCLYEIFNNRNNDNNDDNSKDIDFETFYKPGSALFHWLCDEELLYNTVGNIYVRTTVHLNGEVTK